MIYKKYIKRPLDILFCIIGLTILFPILIIAILAITLSIRENPFFTQKRPGKNQKVFSVMKLKTMNSKKDNNGELLSDTERLTPMGIFIRKTSIDELPQLFNVLKGDMSLIGPRPLLVKYLPFYKPEEKIRFSVRPGITGLAQISGRNYITWDEKFKKDVEYVTHLNFSQDAYIFYKTVIKVLKSDDVRLDQSSFMPNLDEERLHMVSKDK